MAFLVGILFGVVGSLWLDIISDYVKNSAEKQAAKREEEIKKAVQELMGQK